MEAPADGLLPVAISVALSKGLHMLNVLLLLLLLLLSTGEEMRFLLTQTEASHN